MPKANQPRVGRQPRRGRTVPSEMVKHPVIDNRKPLSTEEIGEILNIPPERIREMKEFAAEWFGKKKNSQTTR